MQTWYALYFSAGAVLSPFLPLLYKEYGLSPHAIGVLAALRPWVSLPAGAAWSTLADCTGWHRGVVLCALCGSAAAKLAQAWLRGFWPLALAVAGGQALDAPATITVDAATAAHCATPAARAVGDNYGGARLYGAVAWGLWAAAGGWALGALGWPALFAAHVTLAALALLPTLCLDLSVLRASREKETVVFKTPSLTAGKRWGGDVDADETEAKALLPAATTGSREQPARHAAAAQTPPALPCLSSSDGVRGVAEPASVTDVAGEPESAGATASDVEAHTVLDPDEVLDFQACEPEDWHGVRRHESLRSLACDPDAMLFLGSLVVMGYAMGTIETYLFLELEQLGGPPALAGLTLTVTCIAEPVVFFYAATLQHRLGLTGCLHVVFAAFAVRLASYSSLASWPTPWLVLPVELLHGLTFGLTWACVTAWAAAAAPPDRRASVQSAAQGAYMSLGYGAGALAGGALYSVGGPAAPFYVALGVVCVGWATSMAARAWLDRQKTGYARRQPDPSVEMAVHGVSTASVS